MTDRAGACSTPSRGTSNAAESARPTLAVVNALELYRASKERRSPRAEAEVATEEPQRRKDAGELPADEWDWENW